MIENLLGVLLGLIFTVIALFWGVRGLTDPTKGRNAASGGIAFAVLAIAFSNAAWRIVFRGHGLGGSLDMSTGVDPGFYLIVVGQAAALAVSIWAWVRSR